MDIIALGGLIRDTRKSLNLTLQGLADKSGVSIPHLSKIERGVATASRENIKAIARALALDEGRLLEMAGFSSSEYRTKLTLTGLSESIVAEAPSLYGSKPAKLSDVIVDWLEVCDEDLTQRQMIDIAEEMVAYYEVRKRQILKRGGGTEE